LSNPYFDDVPPFLARVVGMAMILIGALSVSFSCFAVVLFLGGRFDPTGTLVIVGIFGTLGPPLLIWGYRVLLGKGRRADGGVIGPVILCVAGTVFLAYPIVALLRKDWTWIVGVVNLGAAAACFALAHFRSQLARRLATPKDRARAEWRPKM
jgi:hypothetical protein